MPRSWTRTSTVHECQQRLCTARVRHTGSDAATIVRSVTGLDGVEVWGTLHANNRRRTLGDCSVCNVKTVGGKVKEIDDGARRRCEDFRSMETVDVALHMSQSCERSKAEEAVLDEELVHTVRDMLVDLARPTLRCWTIPCLSHQRL